MTNVAQYVGLDVHKDSISIAVTRDGRDPADHVARISNDPTQLLKKLDPVVSGNSIALPLSDLRLCVPPVR